MSQAVLPWNRKPAEPDRRPAPPALRIAAGAARGADTLLTTLLALVLGLVFLYACFALWDTWRIYDDAGIDDNLLQYKPQLDQEEGAGFAELLAINPDVRAWLTLDDTHIDYPVVQGTDNTKYVNTDVYGAFSLSGSLFLDYRNASDFSDNYALIYGHHMEGGYMFGQLADFAEPIFFDQHRTGVLYLPQKTYQVEIFACMQTDAYDAAIYNPGNLPDAQMEELLSEIKDTAVQYREIGLTTQDHILALSTCSDTATNARTIVLGRLEEISATEGAA